MQHVMIAKVIKRKLSWTNEELPTEPA